MFQSNFDRCSKLPLINMDIGMSFQPFWFIQRAYKFMIITVHYTGSCLTYCKARQKCRLRTAIGVSLSQEYDLIARFVERSLYWCTLVIGWLVTTFYNKCVEFSTYKQIDQTSQKDSGIGHKVEFFLIHSNSLVCLSLGAH